MTCSRDYEQRKYDNWCVRQLGMLLSNQSELADGTSQLLHLLAAFNCVISHCRHPIHFFEISFFLGSSHVYKDTAYSRMMFRRISAAAATRVACAARMYTPSEELKTLYATNFENATFPLNIVPSDSTLFAKFLYKAAEPKSAFDAVLKDFDTVAAASTKLPVFWERTADVESMAEFKGLSPAMFFTLVWMQNNGMLELLPAVRESFETYVNAQKKKAVAKIFVNDAKDASIAEGKKIAQELFKSAQELAGYTLEFKVVIDKDIVSGFAVELIGLYVNQAKGAEASTKISADDVDYTNVPTPKVTKTIWEDNVETEMLRKYIDQLALYDAEEAKNGV